MKTKGSPDELEHRRQLAVQRCLEGYSVDEVAAFLGSSLRTVWRWLAAFRNRGPQGLKARPVPGRPRLADDNPRPVSLKSLAECLPRHKVTWREGIKGKLSAKFAWVRVWPGQDWAEGGCAGAEAIWLLIEERADGKIQYAFSNLPARTSRIQAVRLWKSRWPVEQGYQPMKEELGLNHFEGRSWRGFHHWDLSPSGTTSTLRR
jgi:SRSO17 transposase